MGFFKRKDRIIDLSERTNNSIYSKEEVKKNNSEEKSNPFGFLTNLASNSSKNMETISEESNDTIEEKRKKLTRRLLDITEKIENLSNSIYHVEQRLEVLEKKLRINEFD